MSNFLKKFMFAILILMMPHVNSASKAIDTEDYEGSTTCSVKLISMKDDQKDVLSSVKHSPSSQIVSLEGSEVPWKSYVFSSLRNVAQSASSILEFASRSPKNALFFGVILTSQAVVMAQPSYWCWDVCKDGSQVQGLGYPSSSECYNECTLSNCYQNGACEPSTGGCLKTYCSLGQ